MKKGILLWLLLSSVFVQAQTLKDALFGGKLKNDPGTVIRKGDDLASKIDSTHNVTSVTADSSMKEITVSKDSTSLSTADKMNNIGDTALAVSSSASTPAGNAVAPKNNNTIWKDYMDSVISTLKSEVIPSKKVKRGTYYVMVTYTIGTDGQVTVGDILLTPENGYLQQQIKTRLDIDTPQLSPVLSSNGTPRKVIKKYNFTLSKE